MVFLEKEAYYLAFAFFCAALSKCTIILQNDIQKMKNVLALFLFGIACATGASDEPSLGQKNKDDGLTQLTEEDLKGGIFVPEAHIEEFERMMIEPQNELMEMQSEVLKNHARQLGYRGGYGGYGGHGRRMWCFRVGYGHGGGYGHSYRRMEVNEDEIEPLDTNEIAEDGKEADRKLGYGYGRRGRRCVKYHRLLCCKRRHGYYGGYAGGGY